MSARPEASTPGPPSEGRRALAAVGSCFWATRALLSRAGLLQAPGEGAAAAHALLGPQRRRTDWAECGQAQGAGQGRQGARPCPLCRTGATLTAAARPSRGPNTHPSRGA